MPDRHDHPHEHDHSHPHRDHADAPELVQMGVEAFGVGAVITAPPEVLPHIRQILPPGSREKTRTEDDEHFLIEPQETGVYRVVQSNEDAAESVSGSADLRIALEVLDTRLRAHVALRAPEHIFVHAGVVGYRGRAIVLPGSSFTGKTTLVAELVRAGATYYSDEYAVLDEAGSVHPYPKPLSIRSGGRSQVDHPVETIGGEAGAEPLAVGLVVGAQYSPGAGWDPRRLSSGEAVIALFEHTVAAQVRPEEAMATIAKAVEGAVVLQGPRGEASAVVPELLAILED